MCPKMKLLAVKFRYILEVFAWWGLWRKFWPHFHNLCVQKWSCFLQRSDAFWKFAPCEVYNKSSGCIITIVASTKEAVCREVQMVFGRFLHASFIKKVVGALSRIVHPKMKLFVVEFRRISEVLALCGLWRKFLAHYHDFYVQKRSCLLWSSDAIWKFSACNVQKKISGRIIMIYVSENKVVCSEVQTHFGSSLPESFAEKVLGAYSRFLRPKMKLFTAKFRHDLEVFALRGI